MSTNPPSNSQAAGRSQINGLPEVMLLDQRRPSATGGAGPIARSSSAFDADDSWLRIV